MQGFGAHAGPERVLAVFGDVFQILLFGQHLLEFQGGNILGIENDITFKINDMFQFLGTDFKQHTDARRYAPEKPDMGHFGIQFDMPHAFAAYRRQSDLHSTLFTNYSLVFQALVFAAQTAKILGGTEYLGAEQPITLGLESTVIYGFRLGDFPDKTSSL